MDVECLQNIQTVSSFPNFVVILAGKVWHEMTECEQNQQVYLLETMHFLHLFLGMMTVKNTLYMSYPQ